jgi:hypothetical protein
MRYSYINNIKLNKNNKRVYQIPMYPEIFPSNMDIYIQSKETDRMDLLARKYYGDVNLWWIIAHANKIKGSLFLPKDTQIWIPMNINKILEDYKSMN